MNHETARQILSVRMDGEHVPSRQAEAAAAHVAGCAECRAFVDGAARIRRSVRIRAAESVPDLVEPIMAAVATERARGVRVPVARASAVRAVRLRPHRPRHRHPWTLAPAAAAALAGLVLGSVLVGGPWQRPADRPVAAAAVVRGIRAAAPTVDAFRARYRIVETGFSSEVPRRTLDMDIAYLAPQRFRLQVHDRTAYPDRSWTPSDLLFVENVASTYSSGPSGCPGDLPAAVCPPTRATVTRVARYSAAAPLPADLVLPIATFGSARGLRVIGTERIDSRDVVQVRLSFARAAPLFPFLRVGGEWRPFFDRDRVDLWLDATTWVPIRWTVFPAADPERRAWELRFGRSVDPPGEPIMDVRLVSMATTAPDRGLFTIPGAPDAEGPNLAALPGRIGYLPASPADADGLGLVSVVLPRPGSDATPRSVLVYAKGLDYLRVGERTGWAGPGPFGPIDPLAQQIRLPSDGVAYYEPAGEGFGRRLSIHGSGRDLYLETNLSRERLLSIAASIPVDGLALPKSWRVESAAGVHVSRVPVAEALADAGLPAAVFQRLPDGYVAASAELANAGSVFAGATFHLRQRDIDSAGQPLVFHVEPGSGLPPPSSAEQSTIAFAGVTGRWTPGRSLLEWTDAGGYRSLQGDVELSELLSVARAIVSAEA